MKLSRRSKRMRQMYERKYNAMTCETDGKKSRVWALHLAGYDGRSIARQLNLSLAQVHFWAEKLRKEIADAES